MVKRDSLGIQFRSQIFKRVNQMTYAKTLAIMRDACDRVVRDFRDHTFYNVTGNAYTSFTVGLYYKGKLVYARNPTDEGENDPTRVTLRKGEVYNLPYFYGGDDVVDSSYVGEYGSGKQWGPTLGKHRVRRMHSVKRATWNMIVVLPVEYANFNREIFNSFSAEYAMLPNLFQASVVYHKSSSGVSPKEI